jgi:hypothetical protein
MGRGQLSKIKMITDFHISNGFIRNGKNFIDHSFLSLDGGGLRRGEKGFLMTLPSKGGESR